MLTVLDASVMIAALLKDEEHNQSAKEIVKNLPAGACTTPAIFWYEVRNVLLMAMKRGRIEQSDLNACLLQLTQDFSSTVDDEHDEMAVIDLAQRHDLTIYDASYLETAIRRKAKLATFDQKLATAAVKEKIENPATQSGAIEETLNHSQDDPQMDIEE